VFTITPDYDLFLEKWLKYIYPVARTFAYNLLPNHFHAIVQIREAPLLKQGLILPEAPPDLASPIVRLAKSGTPVWVSRGFANFFISYARKVQNRHGFHGAVFHSPFKRKCIGDEVYFDYMTAYVHFNAHKHGLCTGPLSNCLHSSYQTLLGEMPTFLEREYVLNYFGSRTAFIAYHDTMSGMFGLRGDLEV